MAFGFVQSAPAQLIPAARGLPASGGGPTQPSGDGGLTKPEIRLWQAMSALLALSVLLVIISGASGGFLIVGLNILLGVCAGSVGGIIGFLFGIPHAPVATSAAVFRPSTNLEQVSDWLTKIIIGVGLVQADALAGRLADTGRLVGGIGPGQGAVMPQVIIVVFAALGFFACYIWTRLYYGWMQAQADNSIQDMLADQIVQLGAQQHSIQQEVKAQQVKTGALESKTDELTTQTEQIGNTTIMLAKGEIGTAAAAPAAPETDRAAAPAPPFGTREVAPEAGTPDDILERVQQFMNAEVAFDTDPAAKLFKELKPTKQVNGRELRVSILTELSLTKLSRGLTLQAEVVPTDGRPLEEVLLLLHPTYGTRRIQLPVQGGKARFKFFAVEWFTLVAIADGGKTLLSYDLRDVPGAPDWFTNQPD